MSAVFDVIEWILIILMTLSFLYFSYELFLYRKKVEPQRRDKLTILSLLFILLTLAIKIIL